LLPNLSSHSLGSIEVISIVAIGLIAFFLGELRFFFSSLAFQFLFDHKKKFVGGFGSH